MRWRSMRASWLMLSIVAGVPVACGDKGEPLDSGALEPAAPIIGAADTPLEVRRQAGLDVLLITVDTLRADALGSYGKSDAGTPWMDRLASAGIRFDNAHAHNVVTLPSHASILSGLLPLRHGVRDNSGFRFPEELPTLASLLKERGYRTGAFVSAFPLDSRFGLTTGFEVYEDSFVDTLIRQAFLEQQRSGVETVALARDWIEADDARPSFAWVHLYEPHYPYAPPEPFAARFASEPYQGDVAVADAALAPLLEPIIELGAAGTTLVVLASDHGESLGEHGEAAHGIFAYEGALRVPLIFYQPRLLEQRVVTDEVGLIDVLPTILDLVAVPAPAGIDGRSLLPVANGAASARTDTYFEALSGQLNRGWAPLYGVIRDGWKYIELPIPELYDLRADPREETNLAAGARRREDELREALGEFQRGDVEVVPSAESLETRERLRSLGYLGGGEPGRKASYFEQDDPKRLIAVDGELGTISRLYAARDLAAAATRCRDLVRRHPRMRVAQMMLGQIEKDLGNPESAVEAMRAALALHPEDREALALLASYLVQAGRAEEAVALTESHARAARPELEVLFVRSLALARLRRPDEAFAALRRARELEPGNPTVAVYRGTLELMGGRRDRARASYQEALALRPDTVQAVTALAVMAGEDGAMDEAVSYWRRAVALDPREHAKLLATAGRLWGAGQTARARPLLELFAATAPAPEYSDDIARVRRMLD